jgi:hypothetical protein
VRLISEPGEAEVDRREKIRDEGVVMCHAREQRARTGP